MNVIAVRLCRVSSGLARNFRPSYLPSAHYVQRSFHAPSNDSAIQHSKKVNKYGDEVLTTEDISDKSSLPLPEVGSETSFESLGIGGMHPSGLIQQAFEFLHVSVDLPWWGVIATGTVVLRLCMLPIVVKSRQELSKMVQMNFAMVRLVSELLKVKKEQNNDRIPELLDEKNNVMKQVSFSKFLCFPLIQCTSFVSMFFAIRGMVTRHSEGLATGGLGWFTNLTVVDPFYVLPFFCASSVFAILMMGRNSDVEMPPFAFKFFCFLSPAIFILLMKYEAALTFYMAINSGITVIQTGVFNIPQVQKSLKITWPKTRVNATVGLEEIMALMRSIAELEERRLLQKMEDERAKKEKKMKEREKRKDGE